MSDAVAPPSPVAPPHPVVGRRAPADAAVTSDGGETASGQPWPRHITVLLGISVTLGILLLMHQFSGIIGPVFMAINLLIAAYPIHSWLRSKGTPGWLSTSVMFLTVTVILLAAVAGLVWAVSAIVRQLPNYSGQWMALYDQIMGWLAHYNINTTGLADIMQQISPGQVVGVLSSVFSQSAAIAGVVAAIVAVLIFLAMDTPSTRARLRLASAHHPELAASMARFGANVRTYWVATTVFGAIIAALDGVALAIMGVPLAAVWALLSFVTNYIPAIGFVIGLIPPVLLALLGSGWGMALAVIVVYSVLNILIQTILQPRIIGESVGVTASVAFVSLLLWGWVLGGLGTLLALPMTLFLKAAFIDPDPKAQWLASIISVGPLGAKKKPSGP